MGGWLKFREVGIKHTLTINRWPFFFFLLCSRALELALKQMHSVIPDGSVNVWMSCRCFRRNSRSALNRQHEVSHCPTPPQLRLLDYLQKRKERKGAQQYDLKVSKAGNVGISWGSSMPPVPESQRGLLFISLFFVSSAWICGSRIHPTWLHRLRWM